MTLAKLCAVIRDRVPPDSSVAVGDLAAMVAGSKLSPRRRFPRDAHECAFSIASRTALAISPL